MYIYIITMLYIRKNFTCKQNLMHAVMHSLLNCVSFFFFFSTIYTTLLLSAYGYNLCSLLLLSFYFLQAYITTVAINIFLTVAAAHKFSQALQVIVFSFFFFLLLYFFFFALSYTTEMYIICF